MAQIVSGQAGYLGGETGGTGSGVGAVIFDKPDNTGAQMLNQAIQNNVNYYRQQEAAKQKENKEKQLAMLQGIDLDTKGVFEDDLPYFQTETKKIVDQYGEILSRYNGDLSSPQAMIELNKLKGEQARLKLEAEQSADDKKFYTDVTKRLVEQLDKYDPEQSMYNLNNEWRKAKLGERAGKPTLVERTPSLIERLYKFKPTPDQSVQETVVENGVQKTITTTRVSPEKARIHAMEIYESDPNAKRSADKLYAELSDEEKAAILSNKAISGDEFTPPSKIYAGIIGEKVYAFEKDKAQFKSDPATWNSYRLQQIEASGGASQNNKMSRLIVDIAKNLSDQMPEGTQKIAVPKDNGEVLDVIYKPIAGGAGLPLGKLSVSDNSMSKEINNVWYGTAKVPYRTPDGKVFYKNKIITLEKMLQLGIKNKRDILNGKPNVEGEDVSLVLSPNELSLVWKKIDEFDDATGNDIPTLARKVVGSSANDDKFYNTIEVLGLEDDYGNIDANRILKKESDKPKFVKTEQATKGATTGKKYKIKGKEYDEAVVAKKAKESGMSVDEYIKAVNAM